MNFYMKKAYVTGATGAIGMALVAELLKNNIEVTVFLRKDSERSGRIAESFGEELKSGNISVEYVSLEELKHFMENVYTPGQQDSVFYHLGWSGTFGKLRNDAVLQQKNVEYTLDAVRLADRLGCTKFIGVGSQAEYGRVSTRLTPDTDTVPENEYGRAKLAAGVSSRELCRELGIEHAWVRVLSVYGPYDGMNTMITSVIRGLLKGDRVSLTKGEQMWNYLYSEDAGKELYLLGAKAVRNGAVYILAGSEEHSLKEYVVRLCRAMDADDKLLGFGDVPYGAGQVMCLTADIGTLCSDTGYIPDTTFEDGIKKTAEWVKSLS